MTPWYQRLGGATVAWRTLWFTLMWWALSDGNALSWWVGVPAVILAVVVSVALLPPVTLVWRELLTFAAFFLHRSLLGGVDVAMRALHPQLPIAPELVAYPLRLPPGLPRMILVHTVSLLPGTLSADLKGSMLMVHVLDGRGEIIAELAALEQRVARMAGISLAATA